MVATAKRLDAVWYPESDDMGEHELQTFVRELLRPLIERWLAAQGRVAHAGSDQFFYWVEGDPRFSRAPDVYVVDGVPQDIPAVGTWKLWEGHRPHLAIEVCGDEWQKDYDIAPADYDTLGTEELILFDPGATSRSRRRVRWQVFRRDRAGRLVRVQTADGDRVISRWLGCHLRSVRERSKPRLRLATGAEGEVIFPTEAEAARDELARERAAYEAAQEAAQAEIERLRRELARRKR